MLCLSTNLYEPQPQSFLNPNQAVLVPKVKQTGYNMDGVMCHTALCQVSNDICYAL